MNAYKKIRTLQKLMKVGIIQFLAELKTTSIVSMVVNPEGSPKQSVLREVWIFDCKI